MMITKKVKRILVVGGSVGYYKRCYRIFLVYRNYEVSDITKELSDIEPLGLIYSSFGEGIITTNKESYTKK